MAEVIEFYVPARFSEAGETGSAGAARASDRVSSYQEEVGATPGRMLVLLKPHTVFAGETMEQSFKNIILALIILSSLAFAQDRIPTSDKFPLTLHVIRVRTEGDLHLTASDRDDDFHYVLLICEIDGKAYGLRAGRSPVLSTGWYAARKSKGGFEIQFMENGKLKSKNYEDIEAR